MDRFFLLSLLVSSFLFSVCVAEIRYSYIRTDDHPIIPFNEFEFTHRGQLEVNVSNIKLSNQNPDLDLSRIGFFLCTRDSWLHVLQQLEDQEITCALQSDLIKHVYTFNKLQKGQNNFTVVFPENGADQYTLVFANCLSSVKITMDVKSAMYNLSADPTIVPRVYFLFSIIYFILMGLWIHVWDKNIDTLFRIHFSMLGVVILKASHGWDVFFYIFSFLKGVILFTQIGLIGTGWSFLKAFLLQDKEKEVLKNVIPLQVVASIAQVVIDETGPYGQDWITWKQVFLLVDVVCCCAILFAIDWSIKNLSEAATTDRKAELNLMMLE